MVKAYPTYLKDCIELWISGEGNQRTGEAYTREYFDEYGDNIYPRNELQMKFSEGQIVVPEINDICINRFNNLNKYITARGADMVIAAYPIVNCEYTPGEEDYIKLQEELKERLECPIISDFTDYMFDERYFFDSAYHLNDDGVEVRTQKLIEDITNWRTNSR